MQEFRKAGMEGDDEGLGAHPGENPAGMHRWGDTERDGSIEQKARKVALHLPAPRTPSAAGSSGLGLTPHHSPETPEDGHLSRSTLLVRSVPLILKRHAVRINQHSWPLALELAESINVSLREL